jgi:hypothetical protein
MVLLFNQRQNMSKRPYEHEPSWSRTRYPYRTTTPSGVLRATTIEDFLTPEPAAFTGVPDLPLPLVSQSIGSFLDSPFDTVSRRVQQDRRAAVLRAHARATHFGAPHVFVEEVDLDLDGAPIDARETVHPDVRHAALPDMTTTDMRKFVTARVIRALTRLAHASAGTTRISIMPWHKYKFTRDGRSCAEAAARRPHIVIGKERGGGWTVYCKHMGLPADPRLADLLPFVYPHDYREGRRIPGPDAMLRDTWQLKGVPSEGLADAIALCLGPRIQPDHVVAEFRQSVGYFRVYDVQTDDWHTLT